MKESFFADHIAVHLGRRVFYLPSDHPAPKSPLDQCMSNFSHYLEDLKAHLGNYRDYSQPFFQTPGSLIYSAMDIQSGKTKLMVWENPISGNRSWQILKLKKYHSSYKWFPLKYKEAAFEAIGKKALGHFEKHRNSSESL
ncbi:MAG: hypothetical protein R3257_02645, partial [bacterium]|nr:hypothetical protein [bacterium]